jgi:hypothetical protein
MSLTQFATVAVARSHLKDVLDASALGLTTTIQREDQRFAVVEAERLRLALAEAVTPDTQLVAEAGGWSAFLPGLPIGASGRTSAEALEDLVTALREYAADWNDHLRLAPNHAHHWALVQVVDLSTDDQLINWLTA